MEGWGTKRNGVVAVKRLAIRPFPDDAHARSIAIGVYARCDSRGMTRVGLKAPGGHSSFQSDDWVAVGLEFLVDVRGVFAVGDDDAGRMIEDSRIEDELGVRPLKLNGIKWLDVDTIGSFLIPSVLIAL